MCTCICVCISAAVHLCEFTCMHACIFVLAYSVCMHVACMCACAHVCVTCVYACLCVSYHIVLFTLPLQTFRSEQLLQDNSTLHSLKLPYLPVPTCGGTVTRIGRTLYVSGGLCPDRESARLVQSFDLETATWSTLPPSPVVRSEVAVINGHLTLIGGWDVSTEEVTNQVWSWDEENKEWRDTIPSMPTPRLKPAVVQTSSVVAVLGGLSDFTPLKTVDVLPTSTFQWRTSSILQPPVPLWFVSTAVCNGTVYIVGATSDDSFPMFKIPLEAFEFSVTKESPQDPPQHYQWTEVEGVPPRVGLLLGSYYPLIWCPGNTGGNNSDLSDTGGKDSDHSDTDDSVGRTLISNISVLDLSVNKWSTIHQCSMACVFPCLLSVSCSSFLVIGGSADPKLWDEDALLNTCELYCF